MTTTTRTAGRKLAWTAALAFLCSGAMVDARHAAQSGGGGDRPTLEETRLAMGKWIETQRILSRERDDWQQGKEILLGRVELLRKEAGTLEERLAETESTVAEAERTRQALQAEREQLEAVTAELVGAVAAMEARVRRLFEILPEPTRTRVQPLRERIPEETSTTKVSAAERFQNVLGILNEVNKANHEITVVHEVRNLADGKPSEVRVVYVGLAQAYYVSARGEAGIGRPTENGWTWTPSQAIAADVLKALDILQGKHTPAFVPLPMTLQ